MGVVLLPISPTHATTPVDPWPQTNDPFDRILLSVCQVENLRLVTLDRALIDHPLAWRA
jgi:PIN domain nuclease of toxin-antitoxin system